MTPSKIFVLVQLGMLLAVAYTTAKEGATAYWIMALTVVACGVLLGTILRVALSMWG